MIISATLFLLLIPASVLNAIKYQINGTVWCRHGDGREQPYQSEAIIQLWEADANLLGFIDEDDLLGETKSSKQTGKFNLAASKNEWELGELEPYLLIRHICWGDKAPNTKENCALLSRMDLQAVPTAKVIAPIFLGANSQLTTDVIC